MLKNIRKSLVAFLAGAVMVATPLAVPAVAFAASPIQDCLSQGVGLSTGNGSTCVADPDQETGAGKIQNIVTTAINIFSIIVGIVSVVMIIYGGFKYITSGGDSGNVTSAKNTIVFAVIGLIIVALAQFIVQFVLNKVNSSGTTP